MNILDPLYFKSELKSIFKKVELRDYYKLRESNHKLPNYGIVLLVYEEPISLTVSYLVNEEIIKFHLEVFGHDLINTSYKYSEVSEINFDFFKIITSDYYKNTRDIGVRIEQFNRKFIPIEYIRNYKLENLTN